MNAKRVFVGLAALTVVAGMPFAAGSHVFAAGVAHHAIYPGRALAADGSRLVADINSSNKPQDVVVQLAAPPLVKAYLNADKRMSAAQQQATLQALASSQAAIAPQIQRYGRVVGNLKYLVNGFTVNNVTPSGIAALRAMPAVKSVTVMGNAQIDLTHSVPLVGGQAAIDTYHVTGAGTTIAMIDTGIDYTHADFGGPGTTAAYAFATANKTANAPLWYQNALLFPNQKIIGGFDFLGDTWNGSTDTTIAPDQNPIDLNSHGTHTAGIAGGYGVPTGYVGAPSMDPLGFMSWGAQPASFPLPTSNPIVGHGMAPAAKLYAYKVCSSVSTACSGIAMVEAFDQAMDPNNLGTVSDHVDAINMSIGDHFGGDEITANEASLAEQAGIAVAISAGNDGNVPFVTASPSIAANVLGVASSVAFGNLDGLILQGNTSPTIPFIWQTWSSPLTVPGVTAPIVAAGGGSTPSTLCSPAAPGTFTGKIVIINRGTCTFTAKVRDAQAGGAVGALIALVDNSLPFAGSDDGLGDPTIPAGMITKADGATLYADIASSGGTFQVTLGDNAITSLVDTMSTFTSRGPSRLGDLKPDLSAPGDGIISAGMGTGTGTLNDSGTSMAAPHVAGALALLKQAHPDWSATELEAALVDTTTTPTRNLTNFETGAKSNSSLSQSGAGRLQVDRALGSDTILLGQGVTALNFDFQHPTANSSLQRTLTVENKSGTNHSYSVNASFTTTGHLGVAVTASPSTLFVPAHSSRTVTVTLTITVATLPAWALTDGFDNGVPGNLDRQEVGGQIFVTDTASGRQEHAPFYMLARKTSRVSMTHAFLASPRIGTLRLTNAGTVPGTTDLFPLLNVDPRDAVSPTEPFSTTSQFDIKDVGVGTDVVDSDSVTFAIQNYGRLSNPEDMETDIYIDTNNDGTPDYVLFTADIGYIISGQAFGQYISWLRPLDGSGNTIGEYYVTASPDSTIQAISVYLPDMGLSDGDTFSFYVDTFPDTTGPTSPEDSASSLADTAPNDGELTYDAGSPKYNPIVGEETVRLGPGASDGVGGTIGTQDSEIGVLALNWDNAPDATQAAIAIPYATLFSYIHADVAPGQDQTLLIRFATGMQSGDSSHNPALKAAQKTAFLKQLNVAQQHGVLSAADAEVLTYLVNAV